MESSPPLERPARKLAVHAVRDRADEQPSHGDASRGRRGRNAPHAIQALARGVGRSYGGPSPPTQVYPRILDICWTQDPEEQSMLLILLASPRGFEPLLPP